jgi:hypothetical protein
VSTDDERRPSDMPPWIVAAWPLSPTVHLAAWSDGTVKARRKLDHDPLFTLDRDAAIETCRSVLAILEGTPDAK